MRVGVVTDSTCDLPAASLRRARIEAVPLRIVVGDEVYLDWRDIDPATLYDWMQNQGVIPSVRSPDPEDFMQVYRSALGRFDALVSIHVSPRFSRTFENARLAVERLGIERQVTFVDSGNAGAGLAEIVLQAARLARQGGTVEEVRAEAASVGNELYGVFSPSAGSWGGDSAWLGRLIQGRRRAFGQRQLIGMAGGELQPLGWERTARVPEALAAALRRRFGDRPLRVAIAYAGSDHAQLGRLRSAIEAGGLRISQGRMQLIGAAVGARLGPGSATVFARPLAPT